MVESKIAGAYFNEGPQEYHRIFEFSSFKSIGIGRIFSHYFGSEFLYVFMIRPFSVPSTGVFIAIVAEIIYLVSGKLHLKIPRNCSTFKFSKNYIVSCNLQKEILQVHCLHSFNFQLARFQVTQLIWLIRRH